MEVNIKQGGTMVRKKARKEPTIIWKKRKKQLYSIPKPIDEKTRKSNSDDFNQLRAYYRNNLS